MRGGEAGEGCRVDVRRGQADNHRGTCLRVSSGVWWTEERKAFWEGWGFREVRRAEGSGLRVLELPLGLGKASTNRILRKYF